MAQRTFPANSRASRSKRPKAERLRLNTLTTGIPCAYSTAVPEKASALLAMATWHAVPSGLPSAAPRSAKDRTTGTARSSASLQSTRSMAATATSGVATAVTASGRLWAMNPSALSTSSTTTFLSSPCRVWENHELGMRASFSMSAMRTSRSIWKAARCARDAEAYDRAPPATAAASVAAAQPATSRASMALVSHQHATSSLAKA